MKQQDIKEFKINRKEKKRKKEAINKKKQNKPKRLSIKPLFTDVKL